MHMEHWGNGHIDIATMEALVPRGAGQRPKHGQGMQHELPVTVIDPFRVTGGTGGIEGCGASVFIKVRKIEVLRTPCQQIFVLRRKRSAGLRALPFIA